jgi:hypothetical protein
MHKAYKAGMIRSGRSNFCALDLMYLGIHVKFAVLGFLHPDRYPDITKNRGMCILARAMNAIALSCSTKEK